MPWLTGSTQSPTVKASPMPRLFSYRECMKGSCPNVQSGTTCDHLEAKTFWAALTSSMEDSHARISALQEMAQGWEESEADFIGNCTGSQKKSNQLSFFSKTSPQSEQGDLKNWSGHFPIFGMTAAGLVYQPRSLEPRTAGTDGSFLPTLSASSYGTNQGGAAGREGKVRPSLQTMARKNLWPTLTRRDAESIKKLTRGKNASKGGTPLPIVIGGPLNPTWTEWLMGYQIGWTELDPWVTRWFRSKPKPHLKG